MKLLSAATLLSVVLASGYAMAADDCSNAQTQTAMNQCAANDFNKADAQLNSTYQKIEARLKSDTKTRKLLVASERAWVNYRKAECAFQASSTIGGSIHPMLVSSCAADLTRDRTKQLKTYLTCEEGDTACPVSSGK